MEKALCDAVDEMQRGLIGNNLGGQVYKKRIAIRGRGKSGGLRTLLAFKNDDRAIFMYGFAKGKRANVTKQELNALKKLAAQYMSYSDKGLEKAVKASALIEVNCDEEVDT